MRETAVPGRRKISTGKQNRSDLMNFYIGSLLRSLKPFT